MKDRREYSRLTVNAGASFYVTDESRLITDFAGTIVDISEKGIRVEVDYKKYEHNLSLIKLGNEISFQAVEKFELFGKMQTDIFHGKAKIVHEESRGETKVLGCMVSPITDTHEKYMLERRMSYFYIDLKKDNN